MSAKSAALAAAAKSFTVPIWGERYPGKTVRCFGVEHRVATQFALGRTLRNGGREVLGRGLSWEEALESALSRRQIANEGSV